MKVGTGSVGAGAEMNDLSEHISTVEALLAIGWTVAAAFMWYSLRDVLKKIEVIGQSLNKIALLLTDRVDWDTFNHHKHDVEGRMVHGDTYSRPRPERGDGCL